MIKLLMISMHDISSTLCHFCHTISLLNAKRGDNDKRVQHLSSLIPLRLAADSTKKYLNKKSEISVDPVRGFVPFVVSFVQLEIVLLIF